MQVTVRNPQWAQRDRWLFPVEETHSYTGDSVQLKHVGIDSLALSTGNPEWPIRVIPRSWIISIDGEPYTWTARTVETRTVQGSKGEHYTVTLGARPTCTCTGFQFRKTCKHIL